MHIHIKYSLQTILYKFPEKKFSGYDSRTWFYDHYWILHDIIANSQKQSLVICV